jgi:phosphoribosylaminoimidazolecarboxamide formyltransferase/IMP cyclohydrolase
VDAKVAQAIVSQQFAEVILAPDFSAEALKIFSQKPAIRILSYGTLQTAKPQWSYHNIEGGILIQDADLIAEDAQQYQVVTQKKPTDAQLKDLLFAWQVAKWVKSNAIILAKDNTTIGIGAGQMSRIDSVEIAIRKANQANLPVTGSVLASDAFFPFSDNVEQAAQAGIAAIIQPGGSLRDAEVITTAENAGIPMVLTKIRHFRH